MKREQQVPILALGGSIRARAKHRDLILEVVERSTDVQTYTDGVRGLLAQNEATLCNSDILAGAALAGAKSAGSTVDYFPLCSLFPSKDSKLFNLHGSMDEILSHLDTLSLNVEMLGDLLARLEHSSGMILATPVYFGDRSSVANKFLQLASVRESVRDKVYGVVSVGAKRNGGQETCDVFSLYEMLNHGAIGVGNGMPTSQYGGTAVAGDMAQVVEDTWGLTTAFGTGLRVAQVAHMVHAGRTAVDATPLTRIVFLVTMDTRDRKLRDYVTSLAREIQAELPGIEIGIENLIEHDIYRCLACKKCPPEKAAPHARTHCAIKEPSDYIESVRNTLQSADGFVICGVNPLDISDLVTRYQVFTERMRFVRRSDYELSNKLVAGLCFHQFGATINPIHSLKVMVSYVRHNAVLHKPIEIFDHKGSQLNSGLEEALNFCRISALLAKGRRMEMLPVVSYEPYGEGSGYAADE